jgi:hypothetical protein
MSDAEVEILRISLPILQGLLSSGHYTSPESDTDCARVLKIDNGPDWKSLDGENQVVPKRHTAQAIEDALALSAELIATIQLEIKNR